MRYSIALATIAGNILEYFDFLLLAHFSGIFSKIFFPTDDAIVSSLNTLVIFAIGFVMRPLGGAIFGGLADKKGRRMGLSYSILFAALPTFAIACLPTYETVGWVAPILLILCRMGQGLSIGGECTNAGIFLMEHANIKRRCFYSSLLVASGSIGSLCGLGCAFIVVLPNMPSWAWRVPFLIGAILGLFAYQLRRIVQESPEFIHYQNRVQSNLTTDNNKNINGDNRSNTNNSSSSIRFPFTYSQGLIMTIILGAMVGVSVWIPITYTNFYLTKLAGYGATYGIQYTLVAIVSYILLLPIFGFLADRLGARQVSLTFAVLLFISAYPIFNLLIKGNHFMAQVLLALLAAGFGASQHAIMLSLYPVQKRCQGAAIGFSIGLGVFGGSSPAIAGWLTQITHNLSSPSLYIMAVSLLAVIAMFWYGLKTKAGSLDVLVPEPVA